MTTYMKPLGHLFKNFFQIRSLVYIIIYVTVFNFTLIQQMVTLRNFLL